MRNISFALTTAQVRDQTKTVTRRTGWVRLKPGTLLQPVVNAQGLRKGQHVETIGGPIRVVSVRREVLAKGLNAGRSGRREVLLEGFSDMPPAQFVLMFCQTHKCTPSSEVTRIEFRYEEPEAVR
jgi:hypothetical protein